MITVVLPALDEEHAIGEVIAELKRVLDGARIRDYEVLVVNDGSKDRTRDVAIAAGARVVDHPQSVGYGRSLKDGILAARHDTIVISDADLTYPLDRIPDLLVELDRGFDLVVGARTGPHFRQSAIKAPLRLALTWLVEFTVGCDVPDVNSGLRVFRRETILPHLGRLCDTFSFTTSQTLAYFLKKRFVSHVAIDYRARVGTTKVRLFRDSLRTFQYIVQAIVFYNPLKIFLLLALGGGLVAVSGLACALLGISHGLVIAAAGALVALILLGMGLLAEQARQLQDG